MVLWQFEELPLQTLISLYKLLSSLFRLSKQSPFASMSEVDSIDSEISLVSPMPNFDENQGQRFVMCLDFR